MATTNPAIIYLGASRGVGFAAYSSLASTRKNLQSILLLRSVSAFKNSDEYKSLDPDIVSRTKFVQGNAHSEEDMRELIRQGNGNIEAIVFSIGYTPPTGFMDGMKMIANGVQIFPRDLCSRGLINLLNVISEVYKGPVAKPKLILVSSMGIGAEAHKTLPRMLKTFYGVMLKSPHEDKLAMEVIISRALLPASSSSSSSSLPRFFPAVTELNPEILSPGQYEALPSAFLAPEDVCVVRAAWMTDVPPKGTYRLVQEGDKSPGAPTGMYSIGRKDTGGFIADLLWGKAEVKKWWGHQVVVAY